MTHPTRTRGEALLISVRLEAEPMSAAVPGRIKWKPPQPPPGSRTAGQPVTWISSWSPWQLVGDHLIVPG